MQYVLVDPTRTLARAACTLQRLLRSSGCAFSAACGGRAAAAASAGETHDVLFVMARRTGHGVHRFLVLCDLLRQPRALQALPSGDGGCVGEGTSFSAVFGMNPHVSPASLVAFDDVCNSMHTSVRHALQQRLPRARIVNIGVDDSEVNEQVARLARAGACAEFCSAWAAAISRDVRCSLLEVACERERESGRSGLNAGTVDTTEVVADDDDAATDAATDAAGADGGQAASAAPVLPVAACGPDLCIVGTQKGGTTALHFILAQHPQVAASVSKELHMWDAVAISAPRPGPKVAEIAARYAELFRRRPRAARSGLRVVRMESTPRYCVMDVAQLRELRSSNPGMVVVLCVREPVSRAQSQSQMVARRKRPDPRDREYRSIARARGNLTCEHNREQLLALATNSACCARGDYDCMLAKLVHVFGSSKVVAVHSTCMRRHPRAVADFVMERVGLPPHAWCIADDTSTKSAAFWDDSARAVVARHYRGSGLPVGEDATLQSVAAASALGIATFCTCSGGSAGADAGAAGSGPGAPGRSAPAAAAAADRVAPPAE